MASRRVDMNKDVKKRWDGEYADDWVKKVLPRLVYAPALIEPELARLLGDVRGKTILDAGCGEGMYSRYLKKRGAGIVGIDGSEKMIRFARERDLDIEFKVADLLQPLDFQDECFDAIVSAGVLMSLPQLDTFLSESIRILKNRGVLAISVNHPAFSNPTMRLYQPVWAKWLRRPIAGLAVSYFDTGGAGSDANAWPLYHRTIEEYVDAFRNNGFQIDRITEPHHLSKDILDKNNVEYVTRLPRYIFFKLTKP
jgi:ubiquinone/menaquinone biosynthesis C-methylase UbiE